MPTPYLEIEYLSPTYVAEVVVDLTMSDDDDANVHWPSLEAHGYSHHSASVKRTMDQGSEPSNELTSPAAKTSKREEVPAAQPTTDIFLPRPLASTTPPSTVPAFAPRDEYVKLAFQENPPNSVKLRWLSDVTVAFRLDRELAEVKMSAVTSRFVYISRHRKDIIE